LVQSIKETYNDSIVLVRREGDKVADSVVESKTAIQEIRGGYINCLQRWFSVRKTYNNVVHVRGVGGKVTDNCCTR
jgi:hypothetical protein